MNNLVIILTCCIVIVGSGNVTEAHEFPDYEEINLYKYTPEGTAWFLPSIPDHSTE